MTSLKRQRHMIELVKEVKAGEIVTENYLTPVFIPMSIVYEAIDVMKEIDKATAENERELIDKLTAFVAERVYNGQFTKEELFNGLHAPSSMRILQDQILFIARGVQNEESKQYFAEVDKQNV